MNYKSQQFSLTYLIKSTQNQLFYQLTIEFLLTVSHGADQ
jgi:hypothetical protein